MDINELTIISALKLMRQKKLTSHDLVRACLENIEKFNKKYNVLLTVEAEDKLFRQAREAGDTDYSLPLCGIPIVVKDMYSTIGLGTTAGSKVLDNYVPEYDATVIRKLKEAGAIIIGKANQDAWGHGSSGENSDFGPTHNPYDFERVPGGSSSGSAVAVAMGMCFASTGTDTGSSVRLPAAFCNLVGIKPTYGRVSRYGIVAMASSFDTIGHLTKTVEDNAYLYEITAGKDPYDATTVNIPVPKYTEFLKKDIKGLRIGIPKEFFETKGFNSEVKNVTQEAIKKLEDLGAKIINVSLPHTDFAMSCYYILVLSEISSNLARYDGVRFGNDRSTFGEEAQRRIMIGTYALSSGYYDAYYLQAQKMRTLIKKDFDNVFEKVDILVAPSSPDVPFKIGDKSNDPVSMYLADIFVCPINIAGVPSLNVPCGFVNKLPVGLQFIGSQFKEEIIFKIASAYENETNWYKEKPKL